MNRRKRYPGTVSAVTAVLMMAGGSAASQDLGLQVGRVVTTSFLLNLTYPERTAFRVGIVNVGAGTGLLISASGARPTAEVVTGADNFLWAEAAR